MICYGLSSVKPMRYYLLLLSLLVIGCGERPDRQEVLQEFYEEVNEMPWDSLLLLHAKELPPEKKAIVFNEIAWNYRSTPPYDKMLEYGKSALSLAEGSNYLRAAADANNRIGVAYRKRGQFDSAIIAFQKSAAIEDIIGNVYGKARSNNQLGTVYRDLDETIVAKYYFSRAKEEFNSIDASNEAGRASNQLAQLHEKLLEYDSAIVAWEYAIEKYSYQKSENKIKMYRSLIQNYLQIGELELADSLLLIADSIAVIINSAPLKASIRNTQGYLAQLQNDNLKAIENYQASIDLYNQDTIQEGIASPYYNLGTIYTSLGQWAKSLQYFNQSLALATEQNDSVAVAQAFNGLGRAFYKQGDIQRAQQYYEGSVEVYESTGTSLVVHPIFNLALLYESIGDGIAALEYRKRYEVEYQKLGSTQQKAQVGLLELTQASLVREFNTRLTNIELEKNRNRSRASLTISVLLAFLVVGVVLAWNYRRSARLAKREAELLRQETELAQAQAKIQGEEMTKKRIARDIHDELGNILTLIRVHFEAVEKSMSQQQQTQSRHYEEAFTLLGRA
ncbi:MAG TPA: hypothetical protein DCP28_16240, partial [Cytophagales bacterium]|nr:hypothetical protein [Cytophagales bacterium]